MNPQALTWAFSVLRIQFHPCIQDFKLDLGQIANAAMSVCFLSSQRTILLHQDSSDPVMKSWIDPIKACWNEKKKSIHCIQQKSNHKTFVFAPLFHKLKQTLLLCSQKLQVFQTLFTGLLKSMLDSPSIRQVWRAAWLLLRVSWTFFLSWLVWLCIWLARICCLCWLGLGVRNDWLGLE